MIAIKLSSSKEIELVDITFERLKHHEGYAPLYPNYNVSIFVKNLDRSNMIINDIASNIYNSIIFDTVYIMVEPSYDSIEGTDTDNDIDIDIDNKDITIQFFQELKLKYNI